MKAKEYAKELHEKIKSIADEHGHDGVAVDLAEKAVLAVYGKYLKEGGDIVKQRRAISDDAVLAVIKEQSQKWAAFARAYNKLVNMPYIKENGFKDFISKDMPELKGKL